MTRLEDRQTLMAEITEACAAGARLAPVCSLAGIDARTFQRLREGDGQVQAPRTVSRVTLTQRTTIPLPLSASFIALKTSLAPWSCGPTTRSGTPMPYRNISPAQGE